MTRQSKLMQVYDQCLLAQARHTTALEKRNRYNRDEDYLAVANALKEWDLASKKVEKINAEYNHQVDRVNGKYLNKFEPTI